MGRRAVTPLSRLRRRDLFFAGGLASQEFPIRRAPFVPPSSKILNVGAPTFACSGPIAFNLRADPGGGVWKSKLQACGRSSLFWRRCSPHAFANHYLALLPASLAPYAVGNIRYALNCSR